MIEILLLIEGYHEGNCCTFPTEREKCKELMLICREHTTRNLLLGHQLPDRSTSHRPCSMGRWPYSRYRRPLNPIELQTMTPFLVKAFVASALANSTPPRPKSQSEPVNLNRTSRQVGAPTKSSACCFRGCVQQLLSLAASYGRQERRITEAM